MNCRRSVACSLSRSRCLQASNSSLVAYKNQPRYATSNQSRSFSKTTPARFAFKWFRRQTNETREHQERWSEILHRNRMRGSLSNVQAGQLIQSMDVLLDDLSWLGQENIIATLKICLRSRSVEHARLANRLYQALVSRTRPDDLQELIANQLQQVDIELVEMLVMARNDEGAMQVCSIYCQNHKQPLRIWRAMLSAYRDLGDLIGFLKSRDCMMLQQLLPDVHILNLQLELLNRCHLYDDAVILYRSMIPDFEAPPNLDTRLIMLDVCMNRKTLAAEAHAHDAAPLGDELYQKIDLTEREAHPDETYPKLLSWIVFNSGNMDSIHDKLNEMKRNGKRLTSELVNTMLYAATMAENWLLVERLWTSLHDRDILPTADTFSLRIAASVMAGDTFSAKNIFQESQNAGYSDMIDPLALQTLLAAEMMAKQADDSLCLQIVEMLERTEPFAITPTSLSFLIPKMIEKKEFVKLELILGLSRSRSDWNPWEVIVQIVEQLQEAKLPKDVWNLFVLLQNLLWNDPLYTLETRSSLLTKLFELNEPKMAMTMFNQFLKSRIKPADDMYILMLQGGMKTGSFEVIRRVHQSMKMDMNLSRHTAVLNTLMDAYAHVNSTLAFDIWDQISRGSRGPTQASVSIVLDGCSFAGFPIKGHHIWTSLQRRGFKFNDNNFASYVEMLNKHGMTHVALDVLSSSILAKQDVGPRTISTLYNTTGDKKTVEEWAKIACPDIWNSLHTKP